MGAQIQRRQFLQGGAAGVLAVVAAQTRLLEAYAQLPTPPIGPEHKRQTLRALVDTVIPGPPLDPTPGGLQAGIDGPTIDLLDRITPGVPVGDLIVVELDRIAFRLEPGRTFKELSPENRDRAIRTLENSPSENERTLALAAVSVPMILYYSEVGGEISWPQVGYPGLAVEGWTPSQFGCSDDDDDDQGEDEQ